MTQSQAILKTSNYCHKAGNKCNNPLLAYVTMPHHLHGKLDGVSKFHNLTR